MRESSHFLGREIARRAGDLSDRSLERSGGRRVGVLGHDGMVPWRWPLRGAPAWLVFASSQLPILVASISAITNVGCRPTRPRRCEIRTPSSRGDCCTVLDAESLAQGGSHRGFSRGFGQGVVRGLSGLTSRSAFQSPKRAGGRAVRLAGLQGPFGSPGEGVPVPAPISPLNHRDGLPSPTQWPRELWFVAWPLKPVSPSFSPLVGLITQSRPLHSPLRILLLSRFQISSPHQRRRQRRQRSRQTRALGTGRKGC